MKSNITVNDIEISGPFTVYAVQLGHYIFQYLDTTQPGDVPPDIALLPVVSVHDFAGVTCISVNY